MSLLFDAIAEVGSRRDLLWQFVLRDIRVRYTQAAMGMLWALLMPAMIIGAGVMIRFALSGGGERPVSTNEIASLLVKTVPWSFFSGALSLATSSVVANSNLIGKIYFPREVLPISAVLSQVLDLVVASACVLIALPLLGVGLTANALWALPVILTLVLFTAGAALLLSCANLFFRDVKYIVQLLLSFGMFATPVLFPPEMLGAKGASIMLRLPLSPFIQAMDVVLVRGESLMYPISVVSKDSVVEIWSPWMLWYVMLLSIVLFCLGVIFFRLSSSKFAENA